MVSIQLGNYTRKQKSCQIGFGAILDACCGRRPPLGDHMMLSSILHPQVAEPGPRQHPSDLLAWRQPIVLVQCLATALDGKHLLPAQAVQDERMVAGSQHTRQQTPRCTVLCSTPISRCGSHRYSNSLMGTLQTLIQGLVSASERTPVHEWSLCSISRLTARAAWHSGSFMIQ